MSSFYDVFSEVKWGSMLINGVPFWQDWQKNLTLKNIDNNERIGTSDTPLIANNEDIELNNAMLFSRPLTAESVMAFSTMDDSQENIRQPVILLTLDSMRMSFIGEWAIEVFAMPQVTTLFSFLDYHGECRNNLSNVLVDIDDIETNSTLLHTKRHLVSVIENESKVFMAMMISDMLDTQNYRLQSLFAFIRNLEGYWISHFLLSRVFNDSGKNDQYKIYNASKNYGVSESYFRKLCHQAFTCGPKKQLRRWRAAYSVLQLIEKDSSITFVAGDNGYASASHFSSEIKSIFGITPREFKNLEGMLHE